ncbi:hypothetical protein DY000_02047996 [Brassica cretica]|uniref:Uncharacterized protein n=1 Tax=Brassica cretica TaxID=69181 RepID=A0ABQ7ENZ7_BRACR|nr:hypothetical protein DY000_02047996 [Brassica cretica]
MSLQDEKLETHKFTNTFPTSFDAVHSTSVDTHPRPAKQPLTSIDTRKGTSIDIRAAAKIQEQENIPSPTRFPFLSCVRIIMFTFFDDTVSIDVRGVVSIVVERLGSIDDDGLVSVDGWL